MAVKRMTPPMEAKGLFTLRAPFTLVYGIEYKVAAVRSLEEVRVLDSDPFTRIYANNGLSQADYDADRAAGAMIVTLLAVNQPPVFVPDTYIESFPSSDSVPYSRLVLSVNLGPLPTEFDTALLEEQVAGVVSDYLGVTPSVRVGHLPFTGVVTHDQHKILQTARQAAVKNRDTDRAKALANEAIIAAQRERILMLEQILLDSGVVTA